MKKSMLLLFSFFLLTVGHDNLSANPLQAKPYSASSPMTLKETGIITEAANFWTGPPDIASSMVFLKLAKGTEVEILEKEHFFYKIMHRNLIGYVETRVVKILEAEGEAPAAIEEEMTSKGEAAVIEEPEAPPAKAALHRVTKATSLRTAPDSQARVYLRLREGNKVQVLENSGRWWWKVRFNGQVGWAKAALLERE